MRAACYTGNRTVAVVERNPEGPLAGEVAIDVAYTGICGTDLHILHGAMDARVTLPAILGHEMAGTVTAVGDGVSDWAEGDAVTVMPLSWCGECPACRSGHAHVCHNLDFLGIDSPGSMQERWVVPGEVLVRLPRELPLRTAALAEPAAVAVHDVRRAGLVSGEQALVVGGGPIGLLIACVARAAGADVLLVEPNRQRRGLAASLGLRAVDAGDDIDGLVSEWTGGAGVPVAFEVSSAQAGLDTAVRSLAVRGRLVVVAIHPNPPRVDLHRFFWRELTLAGARVYERADFEEAVRLLAAGAIPADRLISEVLPIEDVAAAFETLESGRAMKVLIDCGAGS